MKHSIFIIAVVLLFSCNNSNSSQSEATLAAQDSTKNVSAVDLNKQFEEAWNSNDSAKVVPLLADDAEMLGSTAHFSGQKELADKWVSKNLPVTSNLQTHVVSSAADNNVAYASGTYTLDVNLNDKPTMKEKGNYTFAWKKQPDGNFKMSSILIEEVPADK